MFSGVVQKNPDFSVAPADLQKQRLTDENRQKWIFIQLNTFTNWLNEQLCSTHSHIEDLSTDLSDGIILIQVVETLQQRTCSGKIYNSDPTEIQMIMNVQMALDALKEDGVKMVNIGAHDIVEGNLKLILGLVWCLIQRYQIDSKTKIPVKKLMMAWLQSVLPELKLTNFRTNWNDGRALGALLEYCQPGLCPEWKHMDTTNALQNCTHVISLAETYLSIPSIISPPNLSSPDLDELSTITYLSYFMKYNGTGYKATLQRVQQLIPDVQVEDFEECWKDGFVLSRLVIAAGGHVQDTDNMHADTRAQCVENIQKALDGAYELGITSLVSAEDLADPTSDHLGVMALAAALISLIPTPGAQATKCYQYQQVNLDLAFAAGSEVRVDELDVVVVGPNGNAFDEETIQLRKSRTISGAVLSVIPIEVGFHKIQIYCQGVELPSSPISLQVLSASPPPSLPLHKRTEIMDYHASGGTSSEIGHVSFSGLSEPCSIGSIVEVVINAHGDSALGSVKVESISPSGRIKKCEVVQKANLFTATFAPNEVGEWQIGILYDNEHIRGSPFACHVYDANLVQVYGLDVGLVGQQLKFSVNSSQAGEGVVKVSVVRLGRIIPCEVVEQASSGVHRVSFTPDGAGQYKIRVLFNNMEVKGSPFILDIADASSVSVFGENLKMASVDRLSTFMIHAASAECKDITVTITAPSGKQKRARVFPFDDNTFKVEWKAVEAGEHLVDVCLFDQSIYESPFVCNVGDPDLVSVRNIPEYLTYDSLNKEQHFEIDASAAGSGNLEIMINGGRIPCRVRGLGGRTYLAVFTPVQPLPHIVEMSFNNEHVRMSPWNIPFFQDQQSLPYQTEEDVSRSTEMTIAEKRKPWYTELTGLGLQRGAVNKTSTFEITGEGLDPSVVTARLYDPNCKEVPIRCYQAGDKLICEYILQQVGEHRLETVICGKKIDPFPLVVSGYSAEKVKIEPLRGSTPGRPVQFVVDAVEAGKGQLEISVNQGKVPNNVQMQGAGRCLVTFIPQFPGQYVIDVTFNGEQVYGCPIRVDIQQKQVGQNIITPINTDQGADYTTASYKTDALVCTTSDKREIPVSPSLIRSAKQKSNEQLSYDHPRSPGLLQKCELKNESRSNVSASHDSTNRSSTSPKPWNSSSRRLTGVSPSVGYERDRVLRTNSLEDQKGSESFNKQDEADVLRNNEGNLGYTVAHYGDEKPQTVSSCTFTDDGRGTVTSTFTSETRYSSISPVRTFEYAKGTLSTLPDDSRHAMPTTYEEVSAYEISRSSPRGTSLERINNVRSLARSEDDYDRQIKTSRACESEFVTDNRCYGFQASEEKFNTVGKQEEIMDDVSFNSKRHKFFGEASDSKRSEKDDSGDVGMIRTTYKRYANETKEVEGGDSGRSNMASYSASEFNPTRIYASDSSRQEGDVKDSVYSTSSFGTYDRRASELDDSFERFPPPPSTSQQIVSATLEPSAKSSEFMVGNVRRSVDLPKTSVELQQDGLKSGKSSEHDLHESLRELETVVAERQKLESPIISKLGMQEPIVLTEERQINKTEYVDNNIADITGLHTLEEVHKNKSKTTISIVQSEPNTKTEIIGEIPLENLHRTKELEQVALPITSKRITLSTSSHGGTDSAVIESRADRTKLSSKLSFELVEPEGNISSSVVEEALTPGGSRGMDEKREEELDDAFEPEKALPPVQILEKVEQLPHSKPPSTATTPKVTPKTTPRLNLKFIKETKEQKGTFDFGKSKFTSKHEVVRRGKDVEVKLESLKLGKDDNLQIVVIPPTRPSEERMEFEPHVKKSRHTYEISFKPSEVGTHKVMAYVNKIPHPQSPFPIRVYDASEIVVGAITPQSTTNDTVEFTVDAGRAGFGNLEMAIKDSEGVIIPSHVAQLETGTAKFLVTFNPTTVGMHTVNITFNKEILKNSPFEVMIVEPKTEDGCVGSIEVKKKDSKKEEKRRAEKEKIKKEKEEKQESAKKSKEKDSKKKKHVLEQKTTVSTIPSLSRVNKPAVIFVNVCGVEQLGVVVSDPYKRPLDCEIVDHDGGVKKVIFTPICVGDHEINITYGGIDVQGSPFTCRAYDPAKIVVGDVPDGIIDQTVHFIVDASDAGVGNLEVAINEGHIPSMAQSLGQHRYDISFVPREQINHTISVRFNNEPVPGSPFVCRIGSPHTISVTGPGLERVPVGQISKFYFSSDGKTQISALVVRITDVYGERIPAKVYYSDAEDKYVVEYVPKNVGNHQIEIEYEGDPISGSPFTSKAYDANCARLTCVEKAVVGKPCTFTIDAARAGAGNMEIIVSVENRNVPNFVQAEGQAKFKVSFTPQEPKEHMISVRFNGQPIPGSPMVCSVSEAPQAPHTVLTQAEAPLSFTPNQQIRLVGDLLSAQVGQVKGFSIDTAGRDTDCVVIVTDPDGREITGQLEKVLDGYHVQLLPLIPGNHQINIEIDGRPLGICPIIMEVSNPPKVSRLPPFVFIGKKLAFEVDTGRNGQGEIEIKIIDEDGHELPVSTELDAHGFVRANCRFRNKGRHTVEVFLDGKLIGESQYVNVVAPITCAKIINEIERGRVGEPFKVAIRVDSGISNRCSIAFSDPHGNQLPVSLRDIASDIIEAEVVPKVEGNHSLSVKVSDEHIKGSPFKIPVLDLSTVRVIGLKNDRVGMEQRFNVDWSNSGGSEASVRITKDDSEVLCTVKKVKPGLYVCSFTPKQAGLHLVDVKIDGILLPECPYECIINDTGAVRARGDALTRAQRGKTARFEVSLSNPVRGELDVIITDPHGGPLSVRCYRQQDDSYWVEFTPEETGSHKIEVLFADVPIAGSPFKCEVVDPRKVFIKGIQEPLVIRQVANISVNRADAGNGELQIDITDPSDQLVKVDILKSPNGNEKFSFFPLKLGNYKLNARLAGFQIAGTPQTIVVEEQSRPYVGGNAIERVVDINQQASVIIDSKKIKGGLKIDVRGPKNNKMPHNVSKRSDGTTEILFTPTEVGQYPVNVESNNKPISGSPFAVEVVDSHKVIIDDENVDDNNILHLAMQQRNIINVDATAAGNGVLRVEAYNSDGDFVDSCKVESLGYGKYRILFNPRYAGEYKIYLYWSDIPIDSAYPLQAIAESDEPSTSHGLAGNNAEIVRHLGPNEKEEIYEEDEISDIRRIVLRGEGLTRALTKERAEFIIDTSEVSREGRITCALTGQKADIPIRLVHLGNNVYKATYTPLIPGTYELQILRDGQHVIGSPFCVHVDHNVSAAELIHVDTNTLKIGIINEDIKTLIDTRRAGPGQLSAQCMGPSKLAYCELYDHRDGTYTLSVRPSETGKHTLVIKYSNEHVPGSPFIINVSHPPDASKVRVFGPGIEHGILSTFKSNFVVETKGAGAGQLTVRVRGPKGAFNVEMQREKKQERTIHCKYEPKEPGDYQVEVKWHGEHVPGSPFLVMIVDTEQELERFLRGSAPSPQPATPFIPPGWIGTPPPSLFMGGPPAPPRGPYPSPHLALPPRGMVPYGPPPHAMRTVARTRYANGY